METALGFLVGFAGVGFAGWCAARGIKTIYKSPSGTDSADSEMLLSLLAKLLGFFAAAVMGCFLLWAVISAIRWLWTHPMF